MQWVPGRDCQIYQSSDNPKGMPFMWLSLRRDFMMIMMITIETVNELQNRFSQLKDVIPIKLSKITKTKRRWI